MTRAQAKKAFEALLAKALGEGMVEARLRREAAVPVPASKLALKRLERWLVANKEQSNA